MVVMSHFRIPMDLRKAAMNHTLFKRLLRGDAAKKCVVDRAITDLQFGPEGLGVHPVLDA